MDSETKQKLLAPFDAAEVRIRTDRTNMPYITARVAMTRLDEVLPWQWEFGLSDPTILEGGTMILRGSIRIHTEGRKLEFADVGMAPPDSGKGMAKQAKQAVSDAFKRCCVHLGIGRYLYEMQGVKPNQIPKPVLEKALAAVGYHGEIEDRHFGSIGGIRSGDIEDEEETAAPVDPYLSIRKNLDSMRVNPTHESFKTWLAKNTSNEAQLIEDVQEEEIEKVAGLILEIKSQMKEKRKA